MALETIEEINERLAAENSPAGIELQNMADLPEAQEGDPVRSYGYNTETKQGVTFPAGGGGGGSDKMDKNNPVGTGTFSMNRMPGDPEDVGEYSTTLNKENSAKGEASTAEGYRTVAVGVYSHTEGVATMTNPVGGESTQTARAAHAEGSGGIAGGDYSHVEGGNTLTNNITEHAEGNYNKSNYHSNNFGDALNTLHSVGCGTGGSSEGPEQDRKNAHEIMQNGDHYVIGIGGYDGTNPGEAETLQQRVNNPITVAEVDALDWELPTVNIGGREYKIVKIGNQVWMAENLDLKWDGLSVGESSSSSSSPKANYYDNDESTYGHGKSRACGLLYNYPAVQYITAHKSSLCPGWHVPNNSEWNILLNFIGGAATAGTKLKKSGDPIWGEFYWNGTDNYSFGAVPAGYYDGSSKQLGAFTNIASADAFNAANYNCVNMQRGNADAYLGPTYNSMEVSVRLVKDAT